MNTERQEYLLGQLQMLLEKQVKSLKNSDFQSLETDIEQANLIINKISEIHLPQQTHLKVNIEYLMQLYQKLELMIEAEKTTTNKQLRKVENGKMTIRAYHHSR